MARFLAGEGSRAQPSPAGRGGPARPGPAPHAAARSRGSLRGWHRGRGGGSAPLPAAALKGAERRRVRVGCDPWSQVSAVGVAPTAAAAAFSASLPFQRGAPQSRPVPLGCSRRGSAALIPRGCASLCPPGDRAGCNLARWARSSAPVAPRGRARCCCSVGEPRVAAELPTCVSAEQGCACCQVLLGHKFPFLRKCPWADVVVMLWPGLVPVDFLFVCFSSCIFFSPLALQVLPLS